MQKLVLEQQIRAWILLGVLYMAIKDESEITLPDKPSLPEMMRRECLSSWLKVPCYSWLNGAESKPYCILRSKAAEIVLSNRVTDLMPVGHICIHASSLQSASCLVTGRLLLACIACVAQTQYLSCAASSSRWDGARKASQQPFWTPACSSVAVRSSDGCGHHHGSFHGRCAPGHPCLSGLQHLVTLNRCT